MFALIRKKITAINASFMISFTIISVIVIMIITCVIAVLSLKSINSLSTINLLSIRKNKEIKQLDNIIGKVRELHSNVRDYVITKDSTYIKNIYPDKEVIESLMDGFSDSLTLKGNMKGEIIQLRSLIKRKIAFNLNVLKLYQFGGRDIALEFIETGKASVLNDSIELLTLSIKEVENKELETSVGKYNHAANQTKQTIIAASCLLILLGFLFMYTTISNLRQRSKIISELETAKSDSEKAALLKDQFVSNMSHEIRTPLNSIIGFTNLLNDTGMNDEQRDFVVTIKNASENLLRIVNDILDFSKIEAGMMQIHRHPFSLREQLKNIEKLFDQTNNKSDLSIEYILDASKPDIYIGDSVRLNQILLNLISNAIKFTEKGKVTVRVDTLQTTDEQTTLEFKITDTGIGIPPEKIEKIFDRFEQVNSDSTRKPEGTGLGLSIAKSLIELEGGTIHVASTEGLGTEFTFTVVYGLPKVKVADSQVADKGPVGTPAFLPLQGSILLVEDNPLNQKLVSFLLKKWHVDFDLAANGLQACNILKDKKYSLILMDIQMPEMDGYTATDFIRNKMGIDTPIVALTAHSSDNERNDFLKLGMNGYVTKPFQEQELYEVISKYLPLKKGTTPPSSTAQNGAPMTRLAEIEKEYGGDKAYVRELAEIFLSQITLELNNIDGAYADSDYPRVAAIAHSMKSTVSYMGLHTDISPILSSIEASSKTITPPDSLASDIQILREMCTNVISQIEAELSHYVL